MAKGFVKFVLSVALLAGAANGGDIIDRIVAVDADGPQQRHQQRIDQDAGQRVQRKHQGRDRGLHHAIDVDAKHEAKQPERGHDEEERGLALSFVVSFDLRLSTFDL